MLTFYCCKVRLLGLFIYVVVVCDLIDIGNLCLCGKIGGMGGG